MSATGSMLPAETTLPLSPIHWAERGWLPDALIRHGIRRLCAQRLRDEQAGGIEARDARMRARIHELRDAPIAIHTDAANRQHYELPPRFFELTLGKRLKYSSAYYPPGIRDLDSAEQAMLELSCARAQLADGQHILELGCGWGSLTLWMAEHYPQARITAVSNSAPQREYILARCRERGFSQVEVLTRDVNQLELPEGCFDRVVSVEMFEHVRNYERLMSRIKSWLKPGGKLFVHIFCHRELLYPFETEGEDNWMGRHFFTGGLMPAADTLLHFQRDLVIEDQWRLSGQHYRNTANHWLANHDRNATELRQLCRATWPSHEAELWYQRWRMFWMSCAELFGYRNGEEWLVGHYLFARR